MQLTLIIIGIILLVLILLGFGISLLYMKMNFRSYTIDPDTALAHYDYYEKKYPRRNVSFLSGKNRLKGAVYGVGNKKGLIVFSHGIWSGPEEYLMTILRFVDLGYTVFTYTYTSYNGSEGKWAKGLPQSPKDLHAALTFIENDGSFRGMPIFVMGHSWGGHASTAVLNFDHKIDAAVSLSGFNDTMGITDDVSRMIMGPVGEKFLHPFLCILNRLFSGKEWKRNAVDGINKANIPVLLVHGEEDDFIRYEKTSIPAHFDEITNPYVRVLKLSVKGRSGHNNYFGDEIGNSYVEELTAKWKEIEKATPKKERRAKQHAFFENVDLAKSNRVNKDLFDEVDAFLQSVMDGSAYEELPKEQRQRVMTEMS